jgi:hypothetical protein
MSRFRVGAIAGFGAALVAIGLAAPNCASATQIIIDVQATAELCASIKTGIAVTMPEEINEKPLDIYQDGCADGDEVGSLTIAPSGAKDDEVGVRIVAAVGNDPDPDRCGRSDIGGRPNWDNCILARRFLRFVPGETRRITVRLTPDCVGQYCGGALECNLGVCVRPDTVQPDGGNVTDAGPGDSAVPDAAGDGAVDVCSGCAGDCDPIANTCNVDCDPVRCNNRVVCRGALDCTIQCKDQNDCVKTRCETTGRCSFSCINGTTRRCQDIACRASLCQVTCSSAEGTCSNVGMDGGTARITCGIAGTGKHTCEDVRCEGICARSCADGGLGCKLDDSSSCTGVCANWEDAGDGGRPGGGQ